MRLQTLLITSLFIIGFIPLANATSLPATHNLNNGDLDKAETFTVGADSGISCGLTSNSLAVEIGKTYFVTFGLSAGGTNQNLIISRVAGAAIVVWRYDTNTFSTNTYGAEVVKLSGRSITLKITPTVSESWQLNCTGGNGFQTAWTPAFNAQVCENVMGCVGSWLLSGFTVGVLQAAGDFLSEAVVRDTQTTKEPSSTKITWTRLNPTVKLMHDEAGTSAPSGHFVWAQKITGDATKGIFIEKVAFRVRSTNSCTDGTFALSFASSLMAHPWNVANEIANLTTTYSHATGGNDILITFNFMAKTVTTNGDSSTGTPVYSEKGVIKTNSLPVRINGAEVLYMRGKAYGCGANGFQAQTNPDNFYTGGNFHSFPSNAWSEHAGTDLARLSMDIYGGTNLTFSKTFTTAATAGSFYTYLKVERLETAQATPSSLLSSNVGGVALCCGTAPRKLFKEDITAGQTGCTVTTVAVTRCSTYEARLGYLAPTPFFNQASKTVDFSVKAGTTGKDLLYSGTLVSQPSSRPNVQSFTITPLIIYQFMTSDDFKASQRITVKYCASLSPAEGSLNGNVCASPGAIQPNVTAQIFIGARTQTNTTNALGQFYIEGQDVALNFIQITLSKLLYRTETYSIYTPDYRHYETTLYITDQGLLSPDVGRITVTVEPKNSNFLVPGLPTLFVNKTLQDTVYFAVFYRENSGIVTLRSSAVPVTALKETITYPYGLLSTTTAYAGTYLAVATDSEGIVLDCAPFIIRTISITPVQTKCNLQSNATIREQMRTEINLAEEAEELTAEEESQSIITNAVKFAYNDPVLMPNMYWFLVVAIVVTVIVMAKRRN